MGEHVKTFLDAFLAGIVIGIGGGGGVTWV